MNAFRRRRERDYEARKAADPRFVMTPVQETVVESAPLLGAGDGKVRADLRAVAALRTNFPGIYGMVKLGQLDLYRLPRSVPRRTRLMQGLRS